MNRLFLKHLYTFYNNCTRSMYTFYATSVPFLVESGRVRLRAFNFQSALIVTTLYAQYIGPNYHRCTVLVSILREVRSFLNSFTQICHAQLKCDLCRCFGETYTVCVSCGCLLHMCEVGEKWFQCGFIV